ncbi:MAG: NYN domain-containing protein, partial [Candidatus Sericytochromatia bacterium]|nr:NYN domain-containing protein [Candidatus Sericytochromatia bacterium]
FIDAGYLDQLTRGPLAQGSAPLALDMPRLPALLNGGTRPSQTWYYHALPWLSDPPLPAEHAMHEARQRFLGFLERQRGWRLREGKTERRGGFRPGDWVYEQKRCDVLLAVDLTRLAWRGEIDTALLLAGDSDLVPAVLDAREAGVRVGLHYFPGTAHADLVAACHEAHALDAGALRAIARPPAPRPGA